MEKAMEEKIRKVREEIDKSDLNDAEKDSANDLISRAEECANGTPDKIGAMAKAVSTAIIYQAKFQARLDKRIKDNIEDAIKTHVVDCPMNAKLKFFDKIVRDYPLLTAIAGMWAIQRFGLEKIIAFLTGGGN